MVSLGCFEGISIAFSLEFPYIYDAEGKTPLTYALESKNINCVDEIAKFFVASDKDFIISKQDFDLMFTV